MENKSEVISPVLQQARVEYAEKQRKNPNSVVNFRASLQYDNVRKAFDRMFNPDGSFTEEGLKDWERFKKFKLRLDSSVTYYVRGITQLDLFKFLCFYIMKERNLRLINETRKAQKEGKNVTDIGETVFSLMPVVIFASAFIEYKTSKMKEDDELLGDNKGKILQKSYRSKVFKRISDESGVSLSTVKKLFSRFWQRGMNKNALLPDYINSGARG